MRQQGPNGCFHLSAAPRKPAVSRLSSPHAFSPAKNRVSLGPCWKARQGRKGSREGRGVGTGALENPARPKVAQCVSAVCFGQMFTFEHQHETQVHWCGSRSPSKELVTSSDLPLSTLHALLLIFRSNANAHLQLSPL